MEEKFAVEEIKKSKKYCKYIDIIGVAERQFARGPFRALGYAVIVCVVEEKRHLIRNVF